MTGGDDRIPGNRGTNAAANSGGGKARRPLHCKIRCGQTLRRYRLRPLSGRGLLADPRWRRYLAIRQNTLSTSQARNWRLYLTGQATADPMAINMVDAIGKVFGKDRGRGR